MRSPRILAAIAVAQLALAGTAHADLPLALNTQAGSIQGHEIVVDDFGSVYLLAELVAPLSCAGSTIASADGTQILVVAKYDEVGTCVWAVPISQPQTDLYVSYFTKRRAAIALSPNPAGAPDVIVAGFYQRTDATNNIGLVNVGGTEVTHKLDGSHSSVFLARLSQPTPQPGQPVVAVTVARVTTLPGTNDGYCTQYAEMGGVAVAGTALNTKLLLGFSGRGDCDPDLRAEIHESEPLQLNLTEAARFKPFGSNRSFVDFVKGRSTPLGGSLFVVGGHAPSGGPDAAYLASWNLTSHVFGWKRTIDGSDTLGTLTPLSPIDRFDDVEIAADAGSVWALDSSSQAQGVGGPPFTSCASNIFNRLLHVAAASGTSLWPEPARLANLASTTQLFHLAPDESGRLYASGTRYFQTTSLGCIFYSSGVTVALLEPASNAFAAAWEASATLDDALQTIDAEGLAVGGRRLFTAAAFFTNGVRLSFGGAPPVPDSSTVGLETVVHRLNPLTGDWYVQEDWVAATTISRPPKSVPGSQPHARLAGQPAGSGDGSMFWDAGSQQFFAVHPAGVPLTVEWPTGTCSATTNQVCGVDTDCPGVETCNVATPGDPVETYGVVRWPDVTQKHLAGAPADVGTTPAGKPAYLSLLYSEGDATAVVGGSFQRPSAGYSVLLYTGPLLQVVQTVGWDDLAPSDGGTCVVGQAIAAPAGHDDPGHLGYPLAGSPIDTQGVFDVATRTGSLVPVNTTNASRAMRIAWYARDATFGRAWPTLPRTYSCGWPATPNGILFPDSLMGADACRCNNDTTCLTACQGAQNPLAGLETYNAVDVYSQNDPAALGFNPNDEHAFVAPPNPAPPCAGDASPAAWCTASPAHPNGLTLFALRQQSDVAASDPYVLLKVKATAVSPWTHLVYRVAYSGAANTFDFQVTVGQKVPKPYPLSLFEDCSGTVVTDLTGTPSWKAADGSVFARADGTMSADFFYVGRVPDKFYPAGSCSRWLPDATVVYHASWPADIATLLVGQSLSSPRAGFPDINGADTAQVIFEGNESAPSDLQADRWLVRLFDPVGTRWVNVEQRDLDLYRLLKSRVPSHLGQRLEIDEAALRIGFKGIIQQVSGNDPLILLNVISQDDLLSLQATCATLDTGGTCNATVRALYDLTRSPYGLPNPTDQVLVGLGVDGKPLKLQNVLAKLLSAGAARGEGYATVAINDGVPGRQVEVHAMRVACGLDGAVKVPYAGVAFTVSGADVFGFDFGLRHGNDFGGEPENVSFDWRRFEVRDSIYSDPTKTWGTPTSPGSSCPSGGGLCWSAAPIGTEAQLDLDGSNPDYLGDTYFFVRYTLPGGVCGQSTWSGDPSSTSAHPVAKLAEGWIKRVIQGLNPFHQRIVDFHLADGPVATYVSMIQQAGPAYEGPITFNPAADSVNSRGLVEVYETVLRRALALTVESPTFTHSAAVDNALLLVSGRIADLEMLLGNEAWADALDPTIGFGTDSGEYGVLAPSIHAFQNQLPSLLEEELALLRGVDRQGTKPVYNRLTWNFTTGEGEAAYAQVYDIKDQDGNGNIDAADARTMYPQGHGDAWGDYLSALTSYLRLLRNDRFIWKPRVEAVNVLQGAQLVDFRDERKFAAAAAARARTSGEILHLTYRDEFVQDPQGQWQGYKDPDRSRAWGVDDWARRGEQGAYFDWALANALLPATWAQPSSEDRRCELAAEGVTVPPQECYEGSLTFAESGQIDRTTVPELKEIVEQGRDIQHELDSADQGLNPLGLARGVVPFDIDPSLLDPSQPGGAKTHFEQVYDRATAALRNAVSVFDHANRVTQMLRRNQDSQVDFERNVEDQERDLRNRLIEIFGTPYPSDSFYPPGFTGPDLLHYFYVDARDLSGLPGDGVARAGFGTSGSASICYTKPLPPTVTCEGLYPTESGLCGSATPPTLPGEIQNCIDAEIGVVKPASWVGERTSSGELQRIYSEHLRAIAALERARLAYDDLRAQVEEQAELLSIQLGIDAQTVAIKQAGIDKTRSLNDQIAQARADARGLRSTAGFSRGVASAIGDFLDLNTEDPNATGGAPGTGDSTEIILKGTRSIIKAIGETIGFGFDLGADARENDADSLADRRDLVAQETDLQLDADTADPEAEAKLRLIEDLLRQEPSLLLDAFDRLEAVRSTTIAFRDKLAEGLRLVEDLEVVRTRAAADVQGYRYQDLTFRIARNDALQKYRAQFDLAARYTYLAAAAYDYETNLLGTSAAAGQEFFTDIVRHSSLGEVVDGQPQVGSRGLADPLGRMKANFDVLKGQLGFNNPQTETNRFSLRGELLRLRDSSDDAWKERLREAWVPDLWQVPEYRRLARPFAPQGSEPEPALVFRFRTTVTSGLNFFGWPLGGQDSTYDSSRFATKIRSVGLWFENYDVSGLSNTPRVYLIPVGADVLRSPDAFDFSTREWNVVDQVVPVPFPIGELNLQDPNWIPLNDSLSEPLGNSRRFARFRAYHDAGFDPAQMTFDSRLIGRSVWNNEWMLIIPGETLKGPTLANKISGLETFIDDVTDVKLFFQTYSYPGN